MPPALKSKDMTCIHIAYSSRVCVCSSNVCPAWLVSIVN